MENLILDSSLSHAGMTTTEKNEMENLDPSHAFKMSIFEDINMTTSDYSETATLNLENNLDLTINTTNSTNEFLTECQDIYYTTNDLETNSPCYEEMQWENDFEWEYIYDHEEMFD